MTCELAKRTLRRLVLHDSGQDLMEYGLLMFLIAIVAVTGVSALGSKIHSVFWSYIATNF